MTGIFLILLLCGCSAEEGPSKSEARRENQTGAYIYRRHDEYLFAPKPPERRIPAPYPWEGRFAGRLPTITKEYFRCRGSSLNPQRTLEIDGEIKRFHDCYGPERHSLPVRGGKEFIYPILPELINFIQQQTQKRAVITCGHRCPKHHAYVDPSKGARTSKHMIGAAAAFYIEGMEREPEKAVALIQKYYREKFPDDPAYSKFRRYEKSDTGVSTRPWMNKEIYIKLYKPHEGRNFDNRHPYPYIELQVRHDRETGKPVSYSWNGAHKTIHRY